MEKRAVLLQCGGERKFTTTVIVDQSVVQMAVQDPRGRYAKAKRGAQQHLCREFEKKLKLAKYSVGSVTILRDDPVERLEMRPAKPIAQQLTLPGTGNRELTRLIADHHLSHKG